MKFCEWKRSSPIAPFELRKVVKFGKWKMMEEILRYKERERETCKFDKLSKCEYEFRNRDNKF